MAYMYVKLTYFYAHTCRYLLSGSSCGRAFIWEVDKPDKAPLVLVGHQREVTAVCWSPTLMDKV